MILLLIALIPQVVVQRLLMLHNIFATSVTTIFYAITTGIFSAKATMLLVLIMVLFLQLLLSCSFSADTVPARNVPVICCCYIKYWNVTHTATVSTDAAMNVSSIAVTIGALPVLLLLLLAMLLLFLLHLLMLL